MPADPSQLSSCQSVFRQSLQPNANLSNLAAEVLVPVVASFTSCKLLTQDSGFDTVQLHLGMVETAQNKTSCPPRPTAGAVVQSHQPSVLDLCPSLFGCCLVVGRSGVDSLLFEQPILEYDVWLSLALRSGLPVEDSSVFAAWVRIDKLQTVGIENCIDSCSQLKVDSRGQAISVLFLAFLYTFKSNSSQLSAVGFPTRSYTREIRSGMSPPHSSRPAATAC